MEGLQGVVRGQNYECHSFAVWDHDGLTVILDVCPHYDVMEADLVHLLERCLENAELRADVSCRFEIAEWTLVDTWPTVELLEKASFLEAVVVRVW